ncbi:flavodoxin family protein [Aestuariibius sp. HNIBRBA575]|uniref:flavodoxin family protein n=1 Tax=Aestuariibius sp. HNIBRBA575 TaxID=3233343 RepID=UPI0034A3808E
MAKIEIIYFSGYGHTTKQAEAIAQGAGDQARLWPISEDGTLPDEAWDALDGADAILFGSPTYMGNAAWQFKKVADTSAQRWFTRAWQDKLFGGFTNSGSPSGDKGMTMAWFQTLAAQHGGLWVSLNQMPANTKANTAADMNHFGGSAGPLATSPSDASPEEGPFAGDLISARTYGERVATLAQARQAA